MKERKEGRKKGKRNTKIKIRGKQNVTLNPMNSSFTLSQLSSLFKTAHEEFLNVQDF